VGTQKLSNRLQKLGLDQENPDAIARVVNLGRYFNPVSSSLGPFDKLRKGKPVHSVKPVGKMAWRKAKPFSPIHRLVELMSSDASAFMLLKRAQPGSLRPDWLLPVLSLESCFVQM